MVNVGKYTIHWASGHVGKQLANQLMGLQFQNDEAAITIETNHELFQESFEGWMRGDGD